MSTDKIAALEAELAATRAALAGTVDEITDRLDPRQQAVRAAEHGRTLVRDAVGIDPEADPSARTRARVVLAAAAGAVALGLGAVLRRR